MNRALMLAGLFLCAATIFAAENQPEVVVDGKKRNEQAYERMLEQTGWKSQSTEPDNRAGTKRSQEPKSENPPPKSS